MRTRKWGGEYMHQVMSERVRATDWYTKKLRAFIIQQSDRKVHLRKERT